MNKKYKYDKAKALSSSTEFELIILNEAVNFTNVKEEDYVIDIDVEKFYKHCYKKFFKMIIDRNVNQLKLEPNYMTYSVNMQFINVMNHLSLYDVEKIKLLDLAESFIQDYRAFLNK